MPFCLPWPNTVFSFLAFFALGVVTFQTYCRILPRWVFWIYAIPIGAVAAQNQGIAAACLAVATAIIILLASHKSYRLLSWFGMISYSLYLIHGPIGGKVINLGGRLPNSLWVAALCLGIAISASLLAACGFYLLIERPSQKLASAIRYRQKNNNRLPRQIQYRHELLQAVQSQPEVYLLADSKEQEEQLLEIIAEVEKTDLSANRAATMPDDCQIVFLMHHDLPTDDFGEEVLDARSLIHRAA
jgi:MFS family permease